jgi:hypothetical protein
MEDVDGEVTVIAWSLEFTRPDVRQLIDTEQHGPFTDQGRSSRDKVGCP